MIKRNPIILSISNWVNRNFSDPNALGLFFTLVLAWVLIEFFGDILAPIFVSVVLAYLLNTAVKWLEKFSVPHMISVIIVYCLFLGALVIAMFGLLPVMWRQLAGLVKELPSAIDKGQLLLADLVHRHPSLLSDTQLNSMLDQLKGQAPKIGQVVVSASLASIPGVIEFVLYFILVPLLVFFFMKDSAVIANWSSQFLPSNRSLVNNVWSEVNVQIGNYIRGRVIEIILVGAVAAIVFSILGLQYALLLGFLVGLSVIIPYIGAVVVTIPVMAVAMLQWGMSAPLIYLSIAYAIILLIDANILVPLLFAETMDLHPIAIIVAVLIFGGIWGFWGVFFAIPLATVVKAVLNAWPTQPDHMVKG